MSFPNHQVISSFDTRAFGPCAIVLSEPADAQGNVDGDYILALGYDPSTRGWASGHYYGPGVEGLVGAAAEARGLASRAPLRALVVRPGAEPEDVLLDADPARQLEDMYRIIGCDTVDCVEAYGLDLWVDDDGIRNGKPLNRLLYATPRDVARGALSRMTGRPLEVGEPREALLGTILVTGLAGYDGETTALSEEDAARARELLNLEDAETAAMAAGLLGLRAAMLTAASDRVLAAMGSGACDGEADGIGA